MTGSSGAPGTAQPSALSRELRDFLIQFSIALHRFGMYPDGHPSLPPTVERVTGRTAELLFERPTLSIGIARSQLIIEGVATDPKNPVLQELAARLHRHHLGAISLERGVMPEEVHGFLQLIAHDPDHSGGPVGLEPNFKTRRWPHIAIYPLHYERLRFTSDEQPDETDQLRSARTRGAQLWLGLARAALATGQQETADAADEDELEDVDPKVVARAIDERGRDNAYDQVIVGYMLQIADELRSGQTAESSALRKRVSDLVSNMDRGTLAGLLEMGGDASQRRRFLLSASEGMTVDAVVELVQAAGEAGEQTVSHSLLRMLQKLAQHADHGGGRRKVIADESIRDQIRQLVHGWALKDPNPDAYRAALQRMSVATPVFVAAPEARFTTEPRRLVEMALELDTVGEAVERAVDQLVDRGELPWVLEQLRLAYAPNAVATLRRRVARVDHVAAVLAEDPINYSLLDELLQAVGVAGADPLLDALAEADASSTRRALILRVTRLGSGVESAILRRLADERWYVVRNLLGLLSELPAMPLGFDPGDFLQHKDGRVRREAMRLLLRDDAQRERAIMAGLRDPDDHVTRLALTAARVKCPEAAVPLLVTRAVSGSNTDQRVTAIRVLTDTGHPAALSTLLQITAPKRGFLRSKLPPKSTEYLAALAGLRRFAGDTRADAILQQAARARDTDIAAAARGSAAEEAQ
jgi:hypothetical protein